MNPVVMSLTLRGLLGRRRSVLLVLLPLLLVGLAGLVRWASGADPAQTVPLVDGLGLGTLLPLTCLLIGTGVIGSEIDDGSIVYLLAKPVARRTILLSKLVVAWGAALVFAVLPTVLAVEVAGDEGARLALGVGVTAALAALAYVAIFVALSVVTRNAVILGLLYALLWESVLGGYVPGVRDVSVRQWALAAGERTLGGDAGPWGVTSDVALPAALVLLGVVTVGAVVLGVRRLQTLRLTPAE
ncbi:ABC transporter permease [Isoptericola sp. b441]|uniref:ABC transporter permease n=1 Tax=Actinotalea lenta TaxID=3064654 RepID=A0ABT9D761_9CELL|nr:ABC transporter permease [Isoptericola sp. b441]MDO8106375.1 ABC transporter permease [Isoptericola sp. b441]